MQRTKTKRQPIPRSPAAKKNLQIVVVVWRDAVFSDTEEAPTPALMFTVGYLVERNDSHIAVAHEIGNDGAFRGTTSIPSGMIQSVMGLKRTLTIELCA